MIAAALLRQHTVLFAYVQMYEDAPANGNDKLAKAGCVRIKPDYLHRRPWYEVLPLELILAREFVAPVPNEPGIFHVSSFLPN